MTPAVQTVIALALVVLAAAWLIRRAIVKRQHGGCGDDCGAISPELKKLQRQLKR